ncbi:ArsR family transcriptional regulator [Marinicauda algicola]|uniref:ArsR family transcriptional regulator n=1 Tax=Marinicauda algicola TaxID=2029849 RepID=A0A4V3RY33_9PROT|nr:ArsR family transcriptional regulator [Marinicauda algicola]
MEKMNAIDALSALAHEARLDIFRLLVRAGEDGLPAGEISARLDMRQNTASTNLAILHRAGLVSQRREGRSVIYAADFAGMHGLVGFLMKDCCAETPARVDALLETLAPGKGDSPCLDCTSP